MEIVKSITVSCIPRKAVAICCGVGANGTVGGTRDFLKNCECCLESLRIQDSSQFLNSFDIGKPPVQRDRQGYFFRHTLRDLAHLHDIFCITNSLLLLKLGLFDTHVKFSFLLCNLHLDLVLLHLGV